MPDDIPDFSGGTAVADQPYFGADTPDFGLSAQPTTADILKSNPSQRLINPDQPYLDQLARNVPVLPPSGEVLSKAQALRQQLAPEVLNKALTTSPLSYLPAAEQRVMTPTAALTEAARKHPQEGFLTTSAGIAQGLGAFTDFFTSPEGIALLGTGNIEPAAQRGVAAAFSAQMISQTPELAKQLGEELGKNPQDRDPVKVASLVTQGIANTATAGLTGFHAVRPEIAPERPTATPTISTPRPEPQVTAPPAESTAPGLVSVGSAFDQAMAKLKQGADQPDFTKSPEAPPPPFKGELTKTLTPTDLEPALLVNGEPVTGGDTHQKIVTQAVENNHPQAADIIDAFGKDENHIFVDKQGNRYTQDQASKALGLTEPLHSEKLMELKGNELKPNIPINKPPTPQPDWRVSVFPQQGKVPGYVQIVDPRGKETDQSPTIQSLKAAGMEVPDFESLPQGSYTWEEAAQLANEAKQPKPAAAPVKGKGGAKRTLFLRPRSDGTPDILDAIQEEGGIRPPGESVGGEYDGYKESMRGSALLLRSANGKTPDLMKQALELHHDYKFETIDDFWNAVGGAADERKGLRETGGGPLAQEERFWSAASNPKNPKGMLKISVDDLKIGHKFRLKGPDISAEEMEVTHIDPDTGEVTVKDGRKLGTRTLPEGTEIWIQKASAPEELKPAPVAKVKPSALREDTPNFSLEPAESVDEQRAREERWKADQLKKQQRAEMERRAAKPLIGSTGDIGQTDFAGGEDLFSLRETASASNLDRLAQKVHGKSYAELEPWQQDAIRSAGEAKQSRNVRQLGTQYGVDIDKLPPQFWERAAQPYQPELELSGRTPEPRPVPPAKTGPVSRETARVALSRPVSEGSGEFLKQAFQEGSVISSIEPDKVPLGVPNFSVAKGTHIKTPLDLVKLLIPLRNPYAESLKIVLLDEGDRVVHAETLYGGTIDTTYVDVRDVTRLKAIHPTATKAVISHNHPSGDVTPSAADENMTALWRSTLADAGLQLKDHVITNGEEYFSMREGGRADIPGKVLAEWERLPRSQLMTVWGEQEFKKLIASLRQGDQNHAHILYLNTRLRLVSIERTDPDSESVKKAVLAGVGREGAVHIMIDFGPTISQQEAIETVRAVNRRLSSGSTSRVQDAAAQGSLTLRSGGYHLGEEPTPTQGASLREEPPQPWQELRTTRDRAATRMLELSNQVKAAAGRRNAPVELKQELDSAIAEHRRLTQQLRSQPQYVEELLKRMEGADQQTLDDLAGELGMIEPSLLNQVYLDMQKSGKLPSSAKLPEPFSSLQALTQWLKDNRIDSPKRPLRERLNLAKRAVAALTNVKDRLQVAWGHVIAFGQEQAELWKHPPVDDDFRQLIKDWKLSDEQTGIETYRWQQELNRQITDPVRRSALMAWIQAGGDDTTLRMQAESVPARYEPIYRAALELTTDEKKLANQIRADWAQKLETAKNAGMLDEGRENYGPTVWKIAPQVEEGDSSFAAGGEKQKGSPGNPSAKLDARNPFFTFHKSYPTFYEGILAGGVPETMDVAKLVGYYNQAFNKSLSSRALIKGMLDAKAKDGLPVIILSGRADPIGTDGTGNRGYVVDARYRGKEAQTADGRPYVSVDHSALRDWKFLLKTEGGKPILSRADMLVHPDHAQFLKNVLEPSPLRKYAVVRGALKMNRFLKESKFALSPFHMATLGEHALSHTVNPITYGFKIDLTSNPIQRGLVRGGLDLGFADDRINFEEGLSSHGGLWSAIPGIGDLSVKITDMIFKDYLPAIKMKMAEEALTRNLKRYKGKLTEDQIYDLTASQSNAAFGSQNYRLLGRSPMVRDLMAAAMVAPDFLFSRMKFVGQAFKPHGAEQRRALMIQLGVLYVGARVINALVDPDNDPHWGYKDAFSVVYKGRRYSLRTVVQDAWHLATDPRSFWYNRISPIARTVIEAMTKKDWRGMNRSTVEQIQDAASWIVPISAEGLVPGASGRGASMTSAALQSFGVMSKKDTAAMEVRDLARNFNRRSSDPMAQLWQKQRDQETLPDSDYRQLDTLLEADDLKGAKKEYDRLVKSGHLAGRIAARFRAQRPFTGNRARDFQFYNLLSDEQKKLYERAKKEQSDQSSKFFSMFKEQTQTQPAEEVPAFSE